MSLLDSTDWLAVREHYDERLRVHKQLLLLKEEQLAVRFANLALGISDDAGNYSAVEHGLGPRILTANPNAEKRVLELAGRFSSLASARSVPQLIQEAKLSYLQIGVGSEISCMVNPKVCWVANSRTIWTHLVIKHADNIALADLELSLYRDADVSSKMAYQNWAAIHAELDVALTRLADMSAALARSKQVEPGELIYLWADAIASHLYDRYHSG